MPIQIIAQLSQHIELKLIEQVDEKKYYALFCCSKGERMPLICEGNEYIFRNMENEGGHSGKHDSKQAAIKYALNVLPREKIFEFNTLKEMFEWCLGL